MSCTPVNSTLRLPFSPGLSRLPFLVVTSLVLQKLSVICTQTSFINNNIQGSGKTLAYGLPILHYLLSRPLPTTKTRELQALILAPTRELALQVSDHLHAFCKVLHVPAKDESIESVLTDQMTTDTPGTISSARKQEPQMPLVSTAVLVGGISAQKQRRILDRGIDVLVATPGRLWDVMQEVSRRSIPPCF